MLELARKADHQAVNELAAQVHALHVAWRPDIFAPAEELYPMERFEEVVRQRQLYVARLDGVIVGYVLLKQRSYDHAGVVRRKVMEIEEFCVDELCRGHGIGTEMMTDIRALARAFGCTDIQLTVYPQNDEAVAFYQKCGLTIRYIGMQTAL